MAKYINRKQLERASDKDIENFFDETNFEGIFSHEIKSKNSDFYKGNISDIKLEGRPTNLTNLFLNVPKSSNEIPEGPCSFKCRMNITALHEEQPRYIVNLVGGSLHSIDNISEPIVTVSSEKSQEKELYEMWGVDSCECIGYYHYDEENEVYVVDDIRKPNFDHIPYYPGDTEKKPIRITYPHEIRYIKLNDYYLFNWKLSHKNRYNPYEIFIDFKKQPHIIEPKWFIDTLFDDRHNDKSKNFGSATNFLDTLSKQLSAKDSTFVYELLQNANDYPVEGEDVDVEFHITDNYLLFLHSGDRFNVRNISGICGINEKEKVANKRTIGYKGIGFKTVFLHNHYVYLQTGDYSFRFDEGESPEKKVGGRIKRLGAPFQILPIWTSHKEVSHEINSVFDSSDKKYRVRIALKPEDNKLLHVGKNSYENLFKDIFSDANIILFIPNINSVKLFINGVEERICFRDNDEWIIGDFEENIPYVLQESINKTIDKGNSRIPEKYKDFDCTKVSFACKHEGSMIKPIEKATLYCYLPTKASWGFPFLMNTDMIPKGDRNDIETEVKLVNEDESNFNEELAAIAGEKLFTWIRELITSRKYELGSVFSLVPDFKKCKKEHDFYDEFIERFENAFDSCVIENKIVPVKQGIANVKHVVFDSTGLSTSGIMSDEEFLKFIGMDDFFLPLVILRKDKNFNSFLKRYAEDEQKFSEENLTDLIANKDFQKWLKLQDNNNKFLNFLLENDYLENLLDEEIFLEDEGSLCKADELYYDIDKYLKDLQAFTNHLYFISPSTREFFKNNIKWDDVINGAFAEFDCDNFVDDKLLSSSNMTETVEKLKDKDTSIHFFKFLAENVGYCDKYLSLPFIDNEDNLIEDFKDKFLFFPSSTGFGVCNSEWLSNITIEFVSESYDSITKKFFQENFNVRDYSDGIIIDDIILSDDYKESVSESINEDFATSVDFVNFCYKNDKLIANNSLSSYSLRVYDCMGDENWYVADGDTFFSSSIFDYYSRKEWINSDWMVAIDGNYFNDIVNENEFKKFLNRTFGVEELTDKLFYQNVVKNNNHLKEIFKNISGNNDGDGHKNIDFIKYLDDNYQLIFIEEKDSDAFTGLELLTSETQDISFDDDTLYIYDNELKEIIDNDWFPEDLISLTHIDYGNSKALTALGIKKYQFGDFFDEVIAKNIDAINDLITSKEDSISFHNFIIERLASLTPNQQDVMKDAKVYLYGQDEPANNSGNHKTLSANAKELFNLGLVEFADLDIIDPDYKTEEHTEYWETRLENTKFTINHFFGWLKENPDTFSDTLQDENLNISFWRWLKDKKSVKLNEEYINLPILLKDGTVDSDGPVYFSDEYLNGVNIEHSVKIFDENAKFLSPMYMEEGSETEEWKNFFLMVGVKCDVVDILINTVIDKLSEIEDESLPKLFADNRETLEKYYEDGLIPQITNLRVKAHDGAFYDISETIYIDCEKDEPFPYIELPNQISFNSADERRLIKDIIDEIDGDCVETLSEWQQRKLDCYLNLQEEDSDDVRDFHYRFINDLSIIRNIGRNSLKELEHIENIQLLNKNNEFRCSSDLTMGSVYNPFFDFEACGVVLDYISDSYSNECSEYAGRIFRDLNVHCDFQEEDIEYLKERSCALYFWGKYLLKKDASIYRIKELISDNKFDNIACIPTKDYMKCASDLYYGDEVKRYVKSIEDWENKVPLKDLPDVKLPDESSLFSKMPFKESLDFLDSLYALVSIQGQDRRAQLLKWMIDDYDNSYNSKINEYRDDEHALWVNNKNEKVQIKELYALDYYDKTLEHFFGTNPRIVNKSYFPLGDSFKEACDVLAITTITSDDLKMEPVGDFIYKSRDTTHKLYALIIAGLIDSENWKGLYDDYCDRLKDMVLHKCQSIMITYVEDEDINQSLKKFYHKKGDNDFYFVESLDGKRVFKTFVEEFTNYLYINTDDISLDVIEDIMDSKEHALEIIKEQNVLMLNEDFKDELDTLIPGIKRELSGNEVEENEEDSTDYRPSFTTKEEIDEDDEDDIYNEIESANDEEEIISCDDYNLEENKLEGINDELYSSENNDFSHATKELFRFHGKEEERVCEHYRNGTWVCGHMRDGYWVNGYWRGGSSVSEHSRTINKENLSNTHTNTTDSDLSKYKEQQNEKDLDLLGNKTSISTQNEDHSSTDQPRQRATRDLSNYKPREKGEEKPYTDMGGWNRTNQNYIPRPPRPYSPEDVEKFKSHGISRTLEVLEPTKAEIDELNSILGEEFTAEQIADQNHLAQLRLYNNLIKKGMSPQESKDDFVRNAHLKNEHALNGGKYIHKCSAAGGIMYLSPSIWNKIADDNCVVCVYLGAKANDFMYFNTTEDILKWIGEDDIVIKLTGDEKAYVVEELYSGVLNGVKGTAYTLIRINSNEKYNSLFAPVAECMNNEEAENEDEY